MVRKDFDVIIVGAGPAGSTAAISLAQEGVKVALLDRATFPREKICAGAINPPDLRILKDMGVLEEIERHGFNKCPTGRVFSPNGNFVALRIPQSEMYPDYSLVVTRIKFDDLYKDIAVSKGAAFYEDFKVTGPLLESEQVTGVIGNYKGGKAELSAPIVIAADGANSLITKKLGLRERHKRNVAPAVRAFFSNVHIGDMKSADFLYEKAIAPGYAWMFPTGPDTANIGLGGEPNLLKKAGVNCFKLFEVFINESNYARRYLSGIEQESELEGWPIPMGGLELSRRYTNGAIILGDAAAQVNPVTGDGMCYAIEGAYIAAKTVMEALEQQDYSAAKLSEYEAAFRRRFDEDYKYSLYFRKLLQVPILVNRVIQKANENEKFAHVFAGIIVGITPRKAIFQLDNICRILF